MAGLSIVILGATFLAFNYKYLLPFTSQIKNSGKQNISVNSQTKILKIVDASGNIKVALDVEIADTNEKRNKGLGYRASLATNSGMLFIHTPTKKYTYWMKGMQFPIDIIWILNDKIVDILPNVPPPIEGQTDETLERYSSTVDINRVLETNAGFVITHDIQAGDRIVLE